MTLHILRHKASISKIQPVSVSEEFGLTFKTYIGLLFTQIHCYDWERNEIIMVLKNLETNDLNKYETIILRK